MKLLKVNDITLNEPLFYEDEFKSTGIKARSEINLDGGLIFFESKNTALEMKFSSLGLSWIKKDIFLELLDFANNSLGVSFEILTDKGVKVAKFNHTTNAVSGVELYKNSDFLEVEINLMEIKWKFIKIKS